jgi:hypothetical protein
LIFVARDVIVRAAMELIVPEILAEARHLSLPLLFTGLVLGLALWLLGWWSYRFWAALLTTVTAGIIGLQEAPMLQVQPLLAALLLAIAAGLLALALMRLLAFAIAGLVLLSLAQVVAPSVDARWVCFLTGGILATILFRLWIMALTSFIGTLLILHCSLCLLEPALAGNCATWSRENWIFLNWLCLSTVALGAALQFLLYRWGKKSGKGDKSGDTVKSGSKGLSGRLGALAPFRKAA